MRISFSTVESNTTLTNGYGIAGFNIVTSLSSLGHEVPYRDRNTRVQLHLSQPQWAKFFKGQYKIIMTPWESTEIPKNWVKLFNSADEVWTTSDFVKEVYSSNGVTSPLYVYEHGIEDIWRPDTEPKSHPFRFLHIGAPAPRKHADLALRAFLDAFGESEDVSLTIKSIGSNYLGPKPYKNVISYTNMFDKASMPEFYSKHHVMVYPSAGEGFGLIPFQAMAMGMPTICTHAWAPYRDLLIPELALDSDLVDSVYPDHPGQVFEPDYDNLVEAYRSAYDNYQTYRSQALDNSSILIDRYNWLKLTNDAFSHIVDRFGNDDILVNQ